MVTCGRQPPLSCALSKPCKPSANSSRMRSGRATRCEMPRRRQGPSIPQYSRAAAATRQSRRGAGATPLRPRAEARGISSDARARGCVRADNERAAGPRSTRSRACAISAVTISAPAIGPVAALRGARTVAWKAPSPRFSIHVSVAPGQPPQTSRRHRRRRLRTRRDSRAVPLLQPAMASMQWPDFAVRATTGARDSSDTGNSASPGVSLARFRGGAAALLHLRLAAKPAPDAEDVEHQQHDVGPEQRRLIGQQPDGDPAERADSEHGKAVAGDSRGRGSPRS